MKLHASLSSPNTALLCPVRRGPRKRNVPGMYLLCGRPVEKEAAARN